MLATDDVARTRLTLLKLCVHAMDVIGRPHKKLIDGYVKGKMIIEGHIRRQLTDM